MDVPVRVLGEELCAALGVVKEPVDLLNVPGGDRGPPVCLGDNGRGGQELHGVAESRPLPDGGEGDEGVGLYLDALRLGAQGDDLGHLLHAVGRGADDEQAVEQVDGDAVRGDDVGALDGAHAAVCRKDDNGGERGLEGPVQVREALEVQHVHLVDEEHAGDELRDPLVDVLGDHLVDLHAQLLRDLRLLGLCHLVHHAEHVLAALRPRVGHVEVVEGHVLDDLLLLVHVALGEGDVLLRLEVILCRVRVRPAHPLDRPRVCLDVDDVSDRHLLLLDRLVDAGVELELLGPLGRLQADDDVRHRLAVPPEGVLRLLGRDLDHLPLVHLLVLLHPQPDRPAEVLHQDLHLLDLGRVDLAAHHGNKGHLGPKLLGHTQGDGRLARAGGAGKEDGAARHLLGLDHVDGNARGLAGLLLPDEASGHGVGLTAIVEPQALDVRVRGDPLRLVGRLDLLDLHLCCCSCLRVILCFLSLAPVSLVLWGGASKVSSTRVANLR
mmetsp:Transcript_21276/g.53586  ORF Transcript_21276/g.53586 Transcript_21276/m.53586 type:complete len:495 (-) Transcript_21276:8-1492(-)